MLVVKDKIYKKLYEKCYRSKFQKGTYKKKKIILLGTKLYLFDRDKIIEESIISYSELLHLIVSIINNHIRPLDLNFL